MRLRTRIGPAASLLGVIAVLVLAAQGCGPTRVPGDPDAGEDAGLDGAVPVGALALSGQTLEPAVVGRFYAQQLEVSGGVRPYHWAIDAGADLAWISIDPDTGTLFGTPDHPVDAGVLGVGVEDSQRVAVGRLYALPVLICLDNDTRRGPIPGLSAGCLVQTEQCIEDAWWIVLDTEIASTSPDHCGPTCGACNSSRANACGNQGRDCQCGTQPACTSGACCGSGATSACSDLTGDPNNCGQCGNACQLQARQNVDPLCNQAVCHFQCKPGFEDCSAGTDGGIEGNDGDGCETHVATDVANCGGCGRSCLTPANVVPGCAASTCDYPCIGGYRNCSPGGAGSAQGADGDGCETHIDADLANCGACGNACGTRPNTQPSCASASCGYACSAGYRNCSPGGAGSAQGADGDGCETHIDQDLANCGACGSACGTRSNTQPSCTSGGCGYACSAGYRNCSPGGAGSPQGADGDGCETHTDADAANCGSCGHACQAPTGGSTGCSAGTCVPTCGGATPNRCGGTTHEGGVCVNLATDTSNCGTCGHVCPNASDHCVAGDCNFACDDGVTYCASTDVCTENPPGVFKCSGGP